MKESAATALGRRAENEDAYLLAPGVRVYTLADGMGGHEGGAAASAVALTAVHRAFEGPDGEPVTQTAKSLEQALVFAVEEANRAVSAYGRKTGQRDMGTTIVVLAFERARRRRAAVVAWVGDSRCYRLRAGELEQLTADHTYVAALLRAKQITPKEAETHPERGKGPYRNNGIHYSCTWKPFEVVVRIRWTWWTGKRRSEPVTRRSFRR